ncbi:similar to Saccharomyces cerevisiae YDR058C TGL2 Triacylglycerol lipase that is localized to the mitochondria [Maudiozyma saulgeensis]|uniref:Similar to Saccharomyces cerevisiae YDR058C TGL2 Triacylglycerol lipase that is localized to the mitochondria n=1 Tax=Maudiozyma saulgeensis TaxID=1789683 RepID=A0A1X7QXL3_9SACH|nr:similar to Saccharomyces cerevisiae YDR058C TGL2 Triacylglycerol lipase that is localized to the mitochondria [Kazachstania saulgeensis]
MISLPYPFSKPFNKSRTDASPNSLKQLASLCDDPQVADFVSTYNNLTTRRERTPSSRFTKPNYTNYKPPKYPIILCHGLSGFDTLILIPSVRTFINVISNAVSYKNSEYFVMDETDNEVKKNVLEVEYWIGVKRILESKGCTVFITKVPPFGSIEERATSLNKILNTVVNQQLQTKNDKITKLNFIAHSMGGLDCRYLISRIPENEKNYEVASLTTLSTPHGGSEVANYVVGQFGKIRKSLNDNGPLLPMCYYQLTTYYAQYFNNITPNDPDVKYFSYGAYFSPKWYSSFALTWSIINYATNGEPNDGMVTVKSSHWGKYMGTLPNMDHLDIINWRNKFHDTFEQLLQNKKNPESILQLYVNITNDLAEQGC